MEIVDTVNPKRSKKGLIVSLVVLGVIIVGLVVGIVLAVLSAQKIKPSSGTPGGNGTPPPSMHSESLEKINEEAEGMDFAEARQLYERVIDEAEGDVEKTEARVEYGRFLLDNDEIDFALDQFDQVDGEILDDGYKLLFYDGLREYYDKIGDEELFNEYNDKIREVLADSVYGSGG